MCKEGKNGLPKMVCEAQCKVIPIVPIELQDRYFRGLEINKGYTKGEWDANFTKTTVTITHPSGKKETGTVASTGPQIVITWANGQKVGTIWQLSNGPVTDFLAWAWGAVGGSAPESFDEAMTTAGQTEYQYVACPKGIPVTQCNFNH